MTALCSGAVKSANATGARPLPRRTIPALVTPEPVIGDSGAVRVVKVGVFDSGARNIGEDLACIGWVCGKGDRRLSLRDNHLSLT
ncbi:MAG: hypothetical protein AAFQ42_10660 [Pseudomonadota bacterium]